MTDLKAKIMEYVTTTYKQTGAYSTITSITRRFNAGNAQIIRALFELSDEKKIEISHKQNTVYVKPVEQERNII